MDLSRRTSAAKLVIETREYTESAVCLVLKRRPLTVLAPSHAVAAIEQGSALTVRVGGQTFDDFRLRPAPFLEREHLSLLELSGQVHRGVRAVDLPRHVPSLDVGASLERIEVGRDNRSQARGELVRIEQRGDETTFFTSIEAAAGDSGSPILRNGVLIGVCMGITREAGKGMAICIPFSPEALREMRRLRYRTRSRLALAGVAGLLSVLLLLGIRSLTTFEVAGIIGPTNTSQDVESPNTITASNGQMLSLRRSWSRTFPTGVRWWIPISSTATSAIDYVAVGTKYEDGTAGSLFLLDGMGRQRWSYSIPDGECVFDTSEETFDGFYVYRLFSGDLTGDDVPEIIASFVHHRWYPCKIVVFDLSGEVLGEYWHPGYLRTFGVGHVGREIMPLFVLTGSNNRFRPEGSPWNPQGLLAFRGTKLSGQAPPYTGDGSHGTELWYRLLQNVDDDHRSLIDQIVISDSDGDGMNEIMAHAEDGRFYYLDERGRLLRVALGDDFLKEFGEVDIPELIEVELSPGSG